MCVCVCASLTIETKYYNSATITLELDLSVTDFICQEGDTVDREIFAVKIFSSTTFTDEN